MEGFAYFLAGVLITLPFAIGVGIHIGRDRERNEVDYKPILRPQEEFDTGICRMPSHHSLPRHYHPSATRTVGVAVPDAEYLAQRVWGDQDQ